MALTAPGIDAWIFADLAGMRRISISEDGGATWGDFDLSASATTEDALGAWAAAATAWSPAGASYAASVDATTGRVSWVGSTSHRLRFESSSLAAHLGFSSTETTDGYSHTGGTLPAGAWSVRVAHGGVMPADSVRSVEPRGRAPWAEAWAHGREVRVRFYAAADDYARISAGPIMSGRIRVYVSADKATEYAPGSTGGYIDGDVVAAEAEPVVHGPAGYLVTLTLGVR